MRSVVIYRFNVFFSDFYLKLCRVQINILFIILYLWIGDLFDGIFTEFRSRIVVYF